MGLDYTAGCANFRDVGEWVNLIAGRPLLPVGRILRGGKLDFVETAAEIGMPGTIINLRKGEAPGDRRFGADCFHFPISNEHEKYETRDPEVREWLGGIFGCLSEEVERYPVLFHCTSGKDRTGVVVAVLLVVVGVPREVAIEEYLLSEGEVRREWIVAALEGVGDPRVYFRRVNLERCRQRVLGRSGTDG